MKKPLLALTAAALLVAAAGCTSDTGSTDAATGPATGGTTAPAPSGPASSASGAPAPAGTPASSGSTAAPSSTSASAAIADGFPTDLIPVMPGSTPLTTSFEETAELFTASLSAKTAAGTEEILAYYARSFQAQGFTAAEPEVQAAATVQQFIRSGADDTANVAVVKGSSTFTASINVLPESAK